MRYFPSGADALENMGIIESAEYPDAMLSFYYSFYGLNEDQMKRALDFSLRKSIFLDSGGYTARVKGTEIDINQYAQFIDKYGNHFFKIANLDVMDWDKSQKNFDILKHTKYGDRVIQVYHANDFANGRLKEFEDLCKTETFLGLGGIAGEKWDKFRIQRFQNYCFGISLKYKVKLHGFGMMSHFNATTYPFYSVDSTSWLQSGRWGSVPLFDGQKLKIFGKAGFHDRAKDRNNKTNVTPYAYVHRVPSAIQVLKEYNKYMRYITDYWKLKGIIWN
jgi:hypothetical protein